MINKWLFSLGLLMTACVAFAQEKPPSSEAEYEAALEWRVRQEVLNGVYIPKDLGEVFSQLNRLIDAPSKQKFKAVGEEEAARKLHFSLGRWMSHNWGFYGGSRLSVYLQKLGLTYPDDMVRFLIISYHRYLNKKDLAVKAQVEQLQQMRQAEYKKERQGGELLYEETRQRPRPDTTLTKQGGN